MGEVKCPCMPKKIECKFLSFSISVSGWQKRIGLNGGLEGCEDKMSETNCDDCDVCSALRTLADLLPAGTEINRAVYVIERETKKGRKSVWNMRWADVEALSDDDWETARDCFLTLIHSMRETKEDFRVFTHGEVLSVVISEVSNFRVFTISADRTAPDQPAEVGEDPSSDDAEQ